MIDHLTLTVQDLARSKAFYLKALAPLGYSIRMEFGEFFGFGDQKKPYFWLKTGPNPQSPIHLAFAAKDRKAVDAFYQAALSAGGRDNGPPGPRPHYHANFYGAFVFDPDGHPIEAVCHAAPGAAKKAAAKPAARKVVRKPAKAKRKAVKAKKRR